MAGRPDGGLIGFTLDLLRGLMLIAGMGLIVTASLIYLQRWLT